MVGAGTPSGPAAAAAIPWRPGPRSGPAGAGLAQQRTAPAPRPETPQPSWDVLATWDDPEAPTGTVAVCISLHNYANRICAALDSVRQQHQPNIELIVVDDASEDDGVERVLAWLRSHGGSFRRALLVRHQRNGDWQQLATRPSPWPRLPGASCWMPTTGSNPKPSAPPWPSPAMEGLILRWCTGCCRSGTRDSIHGGPAGGGRPWQLEALRPANQIDAMALIRRQAWQQVGGTPTSPVAGRITTSGAA